jgi:hypothetical protein
VRPDGRGVGTTGAARTLLIEEVKGTGIISSSFALFLLVGVLGSGAS